LATASSAVKGGQSTTIDVGLAADLGDDVGGEHDGVGRAVLFIFQLPAMSFLT
jgi:hypothetical protein